MEKEVGDSKLVTCDYSCLVHTRVILGAGMNEIPLWIREVTFANQREPGITGWEEVIVLGALAKGYLYHTWYWEVRVDGQ